MGTSSDAHCFACGYDAYLILGAGRSNHETYAAWPVSCTQCAEVTTANHKMTPLTCEKCRSSDVLPFTERSVWSGDGQEKIMWGMLRPRLILTDGHYRCPKCFKFELRFGTNTGGHPIVDFD
jgi:hypothetical protein